MIKALLLSRDKTIRTPICRVLKQMDIPHYAMESLTQLNQVTPSRGTITLLFLDKNAEEITLPVLVARVKVQFPEALIVAVTDETTSDSIIEIIRLGIFELLHTPLSPEHVAQVVRHAKEHDHQLFEKERLMKELKETNAQLKKLLRFKDETAAHIVHDLRGPLAIVNTAWEIVDAFSPQELPPEVGKSVERGLETTEHAAALIENLSDVYKITSPNPNATIEECQLEYILQKVVHELAPIAESKGITINLSIQNPLEPIQGDREKLHRVFENILSNAVYVSPKQTSVEVKLYHTMQDSKEYLRCDIIDSGPGIEKSELPHLFQKYTRGVQPSTHDRGVGLGLYIVKNFVSLHGGRLKVASAAGRGSRFSVLLPRRFSRVSPA